MVEISKKCFFVIPRFNFKGKIFYQQYLKFSKNVLIEDLFSIFVSSILTAISSHGKAKQKTLLHFDNSDIMDKLERGKSVTGIRKK